MKMLIASLALAVCIGLTKSQAPYSPSGYRPSGRQFELPKRFGENSSQNQYGAPEPPPNQYLPSNPPSEQPRWRQQSDFQPETQFRSPKREQQYSPPQRQNPPDFSSSPDRFNDIDRQRQPQNEYGSPTRQPPSNQYVPSEDGRFDNFDRQENDLRKSPQTDESVNKIREKEARSGRQNYLPPKPTKRTRQRGYPEQTTRRPRKQEEDGRFDDPNVSVSTAVATGQYYLIQPNNGLYGQRIALQRDTELEDDKKPKQGSAKLIYQNVNSVVPQFYTVAAPLVAL